MSTKNSNDQGWNPAIGSGNDRWIQSDGNPYLVGNLLFTVVAKLAQKAASTYGTTGWS